LSGEYVDERSADRALLSLSKVVWTAWTLINNWAKGSALLSRCSEIMDGRGSGGASGHAVVVSDRCVGVFTESGLVVMHCWFRVKLLLVSWVCELRLVASVVLLAGLW